MVLWEALFDQHFHSFSLSLREAKADGGGLTDIVLIAEMVLLCRQTSKIWCHVSRSQATGLVSQTQ